jgi:predicted flap endonuclease-1-like 5' DNA nuclease
MKNKDFFEDKVLANVDQIKEGVAKTHDKLLKVSEESLEGALATGEQWQNILARSLKKGTKFIGKQQDLVFETLEGIKKIHQNNLKHLRDLADVKAAKKEVKATVKKVSKKVETVTEEVKADVKSAKKVVKAEVKELKKDIKDVKATVKAAAKSTKKQIKDLKVVNGIGPKLESILKDAGINNLSDLANAPVEKLDKILEEAGPRYKAFSPKEWLEQAKDLLKKA